MQKTYDECYLMCSTAVYFEGQNNEEEALRSWREALNTIQHNTSRMPSNYVPRNELEQTLQDSLRELELQCRERIDLLNALSESRKEAGARDESSYQRAGPSIAADGQESGKVQANGQTPEITSAPEWLGDDTVPAYTSYSPPFQLPAGPPPPLPHRSPPPSVPSRPSGDSFTGRRSSGGPAYGPGPTVVSPLPSPPPLPVPNTLSRTSSPEKRTMLTTLRSKEPKKGASSKEKDTIESPRPAPSASRAAGLAWNSIARLSGAARTHARSREGAATTTPRKNVSMDSTSRKGYFSSNDLPRQTKTPYLSDYLHASSPTGSHSRSPQSAGSNFATDAAATAINRPPEPETLIDLSDTSSSISRTTTNTYGASPTTSATFLPSRPKQQPDYFSYLDENPEQSPSRYGSITPQRNKLYSTSQPQLSRDNINEGYMSPRGPSTSSVSVTPIVKSRSRGQSSPLSPVVGADDALNGAIRSMRVGGGANITTTSQAKRQERMQPDYYSQPSTPNVEAPSATKEPDRSAEHVMKNLPKGIDEGAARQILNDIVVRGDEVHWDDVSGLEVAKSALKEAVVYPFLRPDLFSGLREPARGMLLFGPPGTGKTMLARAVATESHSTFFSVSASSLTSKWHGESEKLVRALFGLAKFLAPSIIFVDEIDSLLSARSASGEAETSRRTKTEFLIQWSDLQRAAAGREQSEKEKKEGDPSRVLVLAATNLPWDIDEAARRRFVRRQYIPLPEDEVRKMQLERLLSHQKHELSEEDIAELVRVTDGFSGSDITALAKDAAMGPLRNLGEALLHTPMDQIRPIRLSDFEASLLSIRPSVGREGLREHEEWAKEFGERGG
ncbi:hypothetical protein AJ79_08249 [Helicocarpus griseus UAMH5409]|uniref:AAA+ ATPase domain-containing protein n=1 Tax=Helicocarpus griseus UAMH5409 TaxID=1447875 RepID=A0A2B7WV41_9EURO|nr:hypothetical protein AJ79_08249 [Helicocarpus griseus UAMH5409]